MEKFLVFHTRYKDVQIGYFELNNLIELYVLDTIKVSKCLLVTIETIFKKFDISLKNISFLAAHLGPAPYTTLRVVLATLNGINFSLGTPLIGVNGLIAFLKHLDNAETNIILLNAFGNDLYYGISSPNCPTYSFGCKNVNTLLKEIDEQITGNINFWGNGSIMYKNDIDQIFGCRALMHFDAEIVPIEFLGKEALSKWYNKQSSQELLPIYLK